MAFHASAHAVLRRVLFPGLLLPMLALAQASPSAEPPERSAQPALGLGPQGFYLGLPESGFQLRLRGVIQADGREYFQTPAQPPPPPGQFLIRRARLYIEGTVSDLADFRLLPDFGQGQLTLQDAFVDLKPFPWLRLRGGKFKTPFGLERLQAEQNLVFVERGISSNLAPDRDIGVSLHGDIEEGAIDYELAVLNGTTDNGSVDGDVDNAKDLVARVYLNPLRPSKNAALRDIGLGLAGTWGRETGTATAPLLPTFRTGGQQTFFSYLTDPRTPANTVVAAGSHTRVSVQGYEALGPVALLAELVYSAQEVGNATAHATLIHRAWQVAGSWIVTGERASYNGGVSPAHPFSFSRHQWGALEVGARYGQLHVDPATFPVFADPTKSAQEARAWAVAVNWHFTANSRFSLDFERTEFQGGAPNGNRVPENALLGRLQVAF